MIFEGLDEGHDIDHMLHYVSLSWGLKLLQRPDVYPRVRSRILGNLHNARPRTRLYSSLLAAQFGETDYTPLLVRTLAPHLADNDLERDAAACAYALYKLGPAALPYLRPYICLLYTSPSPRD